MNRQTVLLGALAVVLVLVLFWLFAWQPKSNELAEVEQATEDAIAQQALLETQIRALEDVRASAPEIEAALAATESIIPRETALPSALRQLQLAADDSGVDLQSISPGRPAADPDVPELAAISVAINVEGGYYQLVDLLRRLEDPRITPRAFEFQQASIAVGDYPTLTLALTGTMYALLPAPPPPVTPDEPDTAPTGAPTEGATEAATEEEAA